MTKDDSSVDTLKHIKDVIVKRYIDFCKKNDKAYTVKRNGVKCDDFK